MSQPDWYARWFNEDYLALYPHRDETSAHKEVEATIEKLHLKPPLRVLDLACGAGRHAKFFAKAGFDVTGVDLSEELIKRARIAAPNAQFLVRDMRDLKGLGPFDLVVNYFTSFGYFQSKEEDAKVLQEVSRVLRSEGLLLIDFLHPNAARKALHPPKEITIEGQTVTLSKRIEGDLVVKEIHYPDRSYQERVRLYSMKELQSSLEEVGFAVLGVYNDFDWTPWREEGERQIFLAKRCA